jgi:Skp family chaperone for outer membrane proteins
MRSNSVSGLYQKALTIYRKTTHLTLVRPGDPANGNGQGQPDEDGISADERQKITAQIDQIMSENRIEVSPETLAYVPQRRGVLLPLFSNLAILIVLVAALFVVSRLLNRQEQSLATGGTAVLTAESKLIAALKQESDQELQQRDRTIQETQQRLAAINAEKDQLRGQTDQIIQAREQQLKGDFDKQLAAERDRLEKQGLAAAAVDRQMKAFEDAQRKQMDGQLADARRQAEADLAAKQQTIDTLQSKYQSDLESARQDRLKLQSDLQQKTTQLQSQYAQKQQQAETENAKVTQELTRLRAQQDQEKLVLDQLVSGYDRVNTALQASSYDQALQSLASLRKFLDDDSVVSLPTIQRRRGVELFLIGSLEELVKERQTKTTTDTTALLEASTLLRSVSDLVSRGDSLYQSGDPAGARLAYESAIGRIPSLSAGYGKLRTIQGAEEGRNAEAVAAGLRQGNVFIQAGNFSNAVDRYRQALGILLKDDALARQLTDSLMNAGYHVLAANDLATLAQLKGVAQQRQQVSAHLQDLRDQYTAYVALVPKSSATDPTSPDSLATLLQTRILLRQVLDSASIRSQFPDLAAKTDSYLGALSTIGKAAGRKEVYESMNALLDSIQSGAKANLASLASASTSVQPDPILRLLDRLQAVLR